MSKRKALLVALPLALVAGVCLAGWLWWQDRTEFQRALGFQLLDDGQILVTDGGGLDFTDTGSQVFIIDRSGRRSWESREALRFAHSAIKLANGHVLVPDTNADRLVELDAAGAKVWSSDEWPAGPGVLADGQRLSYPNHVRELANGHFLLSGRYNDTVWETDRSGAVHWSTRLAKRQHAPERLANGNTLIADSERNRVIELDPAGKLVWEHAKGLAWPRYAQRLANGNTLITDSNHDRIVEVDPSGAERFSWGTGILAKPYQAQELPGGSIMVADAQHGRLIEIDRQGRILWTYERKQGIKRWLAMPDSLRNGGAENPGADPRLVDGWRVCDLLAPQGGSWLRDTAQRHGGEASFSIQAAPSLGTNRMWGQFIKAPGAGTLIFKAWVKTEAVQGGAGISLNFIDSGGGLGGGSSSQALSGSQEWTQVTLIAEIPAQAAVVGLALGLIGSGQAWWDDLSLEFRPKRANP